MLNSGSASQYPYLVPDFNGIASTVSPQNVALAIIRGGGKITKLEFYKQNFCPLSKEIVYMNQLRKQTQLFSPLHLQSQGLFL